MKSSTALTYGRLMIILDILKPYKEELQILMTLAELENIHIFGKFRMISMTVSGPETL